MNNLKEITVSLKQLLLDPNNPRVHEEEDFVWAEPHRYHEASVQRKAYLRVRDSALKGSILRNGFLTVDRIVVRPYQYKDGLYVVVEGNRRVASMKWILEDYESGFSVPAELMESFEALPVIVVEGDSEEAEIFRAALMGIRHVSGIRNWGGYQRAKLVVQLIDDYKLDAGEVSGRTGLSVHEVKRRYRAFKALEQMRASEDYGQYAKPSLYPVFHEAVSVPAVREWLGWNEDQCAFTNEKELDMFYQMLVPSEDEFGHQKDPKITSYAQVRELRLILEKPEAKRVLLDPSSTFFDALSIAKQEELSKMWATNVAAAIAALEAMRIDEVEHLTPEDCSQLEKLRTLIDSRLKQHASLKAGG